MPCCNICGCTKFADTYSNADSIFFRQGVRCLGCDSLERHRLTLELLDVHGYLKANNKVLHIAPELGLARVLAARFGSNYRSFDLEPASAPGLKVEYIDLCTDITEMRRESFTIVIHHHVLEHVRCPFLPVLKDLHSLVAPGGVHVFSMPFMAGGYREDIQEKDKHIRKQKFGQTDHFRVFSEVDIETTTDNFVDLGKTRECIGMIPRKRLQELRIEENQSEKIDNNTVFFVTK